MDLVADGRVLTSPNTGASYRVGALLERGGFGEVYRARRTTNGRIVCLKATRRQASWHREVYVSRLLKGDRRVVDVLDAFQARSWINGVFRPIYCLVEELASEGDLIQALDDGWSYAPGRAVREVVGLLRPLTRLHDSSISHGDITPANILVFGGGHLKLGDLGSASPELLRGSGGSVRWNRQYAPRGYRGDLRDDVFFMGQLLAMLIADDVTQRLRPSEVRDLPCRASVRRVIEKAVGPAARRYADAGEMRAALQRAAVPRTTRAA
jgi:serine/threonine protein kinase